MCRRPWEDIEEKGGNDRIKRERGELGPLTRKHDPRRRLSLSEREEGRKKSCAFAGKEKKGPIASLFDWETFFA